MSRVQHEMCSDIQFALIDVHYYIKVRQTFSTVQLDKTWAALKFVLLYTNM